MRHCLLASLLALPLCAQTDPPKKLTLAEAEIAALKNHPSVGVAQAHAQAAKAVVAETRSAYYPTLSGNLTGVGAERDTSVAAGNVTTSSLANRVASGVAVNQMLFDFGRTSRLSQSAQFRAGAQDENVHFMRAQVLLRVRQAYFRALAADAVLHVAEQTVAARRLTLRQVDALAKSSMKSSLDVSFAEVNVSEAELALFRAENDLKAALADLAAAMGSPQDNYQLVEEPMPEALDAIVDPLIQQAMSKRRDIASLRLNRDAAQSFVQAESRLRFPTLSLIASAGVLPTREEKLQGRYSAAGINLNIPVLNGSLYSARRAEATAKADASAMELRNLELKVTRDVKVAWLNSQNAFRRLDVTARLLEQANRALKLAQARYDLGLSSMVELTQAQLSKTAAEISNANAKYEYQIQRSVLDYETGALR
jgi:outer membrane protein